MFVQISNVLTFLSFFSKLRKLLRPKAGVERVELTPSLRSGWVRRGSGLPRWSEWESLLLLSCLRKRLLSDILIIIDL